MKSSTFEQVNINAYQNGSRLDQIDVKITNSSDEVMLPIDGLFEQQCSLKSNEVAVVFGEREISYGILNCNANWLANVLISASVNKGDFVPVLIDHSIELVVSLLSILKIGGVYVPIDVNWPEFRINEIIHDLGCKSVLVKSQISFLDVPQIEVDLNSLQSISENLTVETKADDLLYMIFTSGTTGKPKGVQIHSAGLLNRLFWMNEHFSIDSAKVVVLTTRYVFDSSIWEILWPLVNGGKLIIPSEINSFSPEKYCKLIERHKITIIDFLPSFFNLFFNYVSSNEDCSVRLFSLRDVILGGEPIIVQDALKFKKKIPRIRLTNLYGPTEATIGCVSYPISGQEVNFIPIGKPISNMEIVLLDDNLNPVAQGLPGEIFIGGVGVSPGYFNDQLKTKLAFIPLSSRHNKVFYKTGDVAKWVDGNLLFLGRTDDQISIHGLRIEPGEIESKIMEYGDISNAYVLAYKEDELASYLCAYIVSDIKVDINNLKKYLISRLPISMVPRFIAQIDEVKLLLSGKVDKNSFPKPVPELKDNTSTNIAIEKDETTETIGQIWINVLNSKWSEISNDTSFFEYGGDSLRMMKLLINVNEKFNVEISLFDFLKNPTIAGIADFVKTTVKKDLPKIEEINRKDGLFKLSSAQKQMFIIHHLDAKSTNYNLVVPCEIYGAFHKSDFEYALNSLIDRHDSLRTEFCIVNGEALQRIRESIPFEMHYVQAFTDNNIKELVSGFAKPFDIKCAPLFRVLVISVDAQKHVMLIDFHHIISDGHSINIFLNDLAFVLNGDKLSEKVVQYKDYSEWENGPYFQSKIDSQENYWLEKFRNLPSKINLPIDFEVSSRQNSEAGRFRYAFSIDEFQIIRELKNKEKVTTFTLLLTLLNILVSKVCLASDVVIGSPIAGRKHSNVSETIGVFINTLALRNFPLPNKRFSSFLHEVKDDLLNDFQYQDYPFEKLIAKLKVKRSSNHNPLFDIILGFQNDYFSSIERGNIRIEKKSGFEFDIKNETKVPLSFWCKETPDSIIIDVEYKLCLFKESTIYRYIKQLKGILNQVKGNSEICLENIKLED